jgi:acyl-coenzyme A synthetase/AMP-(fatty) acid ligase
MKPGSASLPFFGIDLKLFDPQGAVQPGKNSEGFSIF